MPCYYWLYGMLMNLTKIDQGGLALRQIPKSILIKWNHAIPKNVY